MEGGQDKISARNTGVCIHNVGKRYADSTWPLTRLLYTPSNSLGRTEIRQSQNIDDIDPRYIYHICRGRHN